MRVGQQPILSFGDIRLIPKDYGIFKVQVYLPGIGNSAQPWGEICLEGSGDAKDVGTVICRQYGRTSGMLTAQPS